MHGPGAAPAAAAAVVVNPYDLLGIPRNTTSDSVVDDAYRKWAVQLHPDRGGDPKRFQVVADAYRRIKEQLEHARTESFEMLKMRAERELGDHNVAGGGEVRQELAPLGFGTSFDKATFNQVFFEHRMWDPNQDGYGEHMVQQTLSYEKLTDIPADVAKAREMDLQPSAVPQFAPTTVFNPGKLVHFNDAFRQNATQQQTQRNVSTKQSLVRRVEPDALEMYKGAAGSSLSVEKIEDFSSPFNAGSGGGGPSYTDFMKAYSEDALITQHTGFDSGYGRAGNVSESEFARYVNKTQQLSFVPDPELVSATAMQQAYEREQDELRLRNFLKQNEEIDERHRSLRNILPERSRVPK